MKLKLINIQTLKIILSVLVLLGVWISSGFVKRLYLIVPALVLSYLLCKLIYFFVNKFDAAQKILRVRFADLLYSVLMVFILGQAEDSYYYLTASLICALTMQLQNSDSQKFVEPILFGLVSALFFGDIQVFDYKLLSLSYDHYLFWLVLFNALILSYLRGMHFLAISWLFGLSIFSYIFYLTGDMKTFSLAENVFKLENITVILFFAGSFAFADLKKSIAVFFGIFCAFLCVIINYSHISYSVLLSFFMVSTFVPLLRKKIPYVRVRTAE